MNRPVSDWQGEFERVALVNTRDLLRFARRLTGSSATAEDLVQEALLHSWRSFHQFQGGSNARAWLFRIVVNTWYGWGRKVKAIAALPPQASESCVQDRLEINEALDSLPTEQSSVIALVIVEGFTCKEASDILDIPVGTVMSRLSRGRALLREKLAHPVQVALTGERTKS